MTIMMGINAVQRYLTHKFRHSENKVMKCQKREGRVREGDPSLLM